MKTRLSVLTYVIKFPRKTSFNLHIPDFIKITKSKLIIQYSGNKICGQVDIICNNKSNRAVIAQSVQRWATGWTIGVLRFDSRRGLGIFLFTNVSRNVLGPTRPPIQRIPEVLSLGVKRPGREADHSPPSSAEVKECVELYLHSPIGLHGVVLS
jgi:hypothetical protein